MLSEFQKELIKTMCDCDLKVYKVAKKMNYSRNTIMYHVERIQKKTGLNLRKFHDAIKLLNMCEGGSNGKEQ